MRAVFVLISSTLGMIYFCAALWTDDIQKKHTRLLYSICFDLMALGKIIYAIARHIDALPLW